MCCTGDIQHGDGNKVVHCCGHEHQSRRRSCHERLCEIPTSIVPKASALNFIPQTYIFDIVEVVADQSAPGPKRWYKLKLLCRDDAKGPVTALCGFEGYLVSSMGQKVRMGAALYELELTREVQIFVRAFDADERLVGVAFLDVGVYVTSLRSVKNLLLVGDAVKSVFFVAFQVCFTLADTLSLADVLV